MGDLSPHFSSAELACKHCKVCSVSPKLIDALEELRGQGSELIIIHDAYRCPEHNLAVHGVPHSEHVEGIAADLHIGTLTLQQMYDRAKQVPEFRDGGIGVYSSDGGHKFIHVDTRGLKARWSGPMVDGHYLALDRLVVP